MPASKEQPAAPGSPARPGPIDPALLHQAAAFHLGRAPRDPVAAALAAVMRNAARRGSLVEPLPCGGARFVAAHEGDHFEVTVRRITGEDEDRAIAAARAMPGVAGPISQAEAEARGLA